MYYKTYYVTMKLCSVHIPDADIESLASIANEKGTTVSALIRAAIDEYLKTVHCEESFPSLLEAFIHISRIKLHGLHAPRGSKPMPISAFDLMIRTLRADGFTIARLKDLNSAEASTLVGAFLMSRSDQ